MVFFFAADFWQTSNVDMNFNWKGFSEVFIVSSPAVHKFFAEVGIYIFISIHKV